MKNSWVEERFAQGIELLFFFVCVCGVGVLVGRSGWGRAVLICLSLASIWPVSVDNYARPAPDSGANNEGQIESYV